MSENRKQSAMGTRRRFNFVDLLIILALILIIAIVVNMFLPQSVFGSLNTNTECDMQYTVEFIGVDEAFVDKIKEGDTVVDSVTKYTLGSVVAVNSDNNYTELIYDKENDAGKLVANPDRYNLLITVSVTAEYNEDKGYSVGDRRIAVGEYLSLRFPDFAAEGYCTSLSEIE